MSTPTIAMLPELITALPVTLHTVADRLLFVERVIGHAVAPAALQPWIEQQFGSLEAVTTQTVIRVINRLTLETALFNPLRARRPYDAGAEAGAASTDLEALIAASAGANDLFHTPLDGTTADLFGRIKGQYCISAANIARYDGWHGLVICDEFHPLRFTRTQLRDYFDVALRWLATAHQHDPQARYPLITWNCLWKAGASITHGHLQMTLSRGMACGGVERWRRAAHDYRQQSRCDFFADLWQLHVALGLDCFADTELAAYLTLTPIKDRELLLWMRPPAQHSHEQLLPLWDAAYAALRNLIDEQGMRSFNLAVYLPPFGPADAAWQQFPVCVRIVDRGNPLSRAVNVGAMELFAGSVITSDPFAVAKTLRLSQSVHF